MTDAELRAKHVERFDCSLCRAEAETPHNPVWDFPSGSCRVCYEEMPCAILALLTRCEKAEAGFEPERINRAAHRRGDDCAYMYGRECDCQEPDRLRAALARLEPTDERDIEAKRIENFLNGAAEGINQETGFPVFEHRVKVEWEDD